MLEPSAAEAAQRLVSCWPLHLKLTSDMVNRLLQVYDLLIERQNAGTLTTEGRRLLMELRDEADTWMLSKAHAYALLQIQDRL